MTIDLYMINAFTTNTFGGNPTAVCMLTEWLDDDVMQNMAAQHNLSETAFVVPAPDAESDFHIRWFTPTCEVELSGHATLASAHVIFTELKFSKAVITLQSKVGELTVTKGDDGQLHMNFPKGQLEKSPVLGTYHAVFGNRPVEAYECPNLDDSNTDLVLVFDEIEKLTHPDINFKAMATLHYRRIIITVASNDVDFLCRVFAPKLGIVEDFVTGAAYTLLTPLWAEKTQKTVLSAKQVSSRGGEIWSELLGERVRISGYNTLYSKGQIEFSE